MRIVSESVSFSSSFLTRKSLIFFSQYCISCSITLSVYLWSLGWYSVWDGWDGHSIDVPILGYIPMSSHDIVVVQYKMT